MFVFVVFVVVMVVAIRCDGRAFTGFGDGRCRMIVVVMLSMIVMIAVIVLVVGVLGTGLDGRVQRRQFDIAGGRFIGFAGFVPGVFVGLGDDRVRLDSRARGRGFGEPGCRIRYRVHLRCASAAGASEPWNCSCGAVSEPRASVMPGCSAGNPPNASSPGVWSRVRRHRLGAGGIARAIGAGGAVAAAAAATAGAVVGIGVGGAGVAFFLRDQRLPVGDRDLIIVGMDFGEGEEAVTVAAVIDEGSLQRRLNAGDLGEVDIAAELFAVSGLEVEFFDPVAAENHDPCFFRVGGVDQHFVGH